MRIVQWLQQMARSCKASQHQLQSTITATAASEGRAQEVVVLLPLLLPPLPKALSLLLLLLLSAQLVQHRVCTQCSCQLLCWVLLSSTSLKTLSCCQEHGGGLWGSLLLLLLLLGVKLSMALQWQDPQDVKLLPTWGSRACRLQCCHLLPGHQPLLSAALCCSLAS
jgi:hypothetical protein